MRDGQHRVKCRTRCSLHTVVRPQGLRSVRNLDRLERPTARMGAGEGRMTGWMPVLGQDDMSEPASEPIDRRNDCIAVRYGEGAAGTEIILHIDNDQNLALASRHCGGAVGHVSSSIFVEAIIPLHIGPAE